MICDKNSGYLILHLFSPPMEKQNTTNIEEPKEFEKYFFHEGRKDIGVLILPGFGSDLEEIKLIIKYLVQKNLTVLASSFRGYNRDFNYEEINERTPEEWLSSAKERLDELSEKVERVFIIGFSFGGNLAVSLVKNNAEKVKGIVTLEMPVFFKTKIDFALRILRPLCRLFKLDYLRKSPLWYRSGYKRCDKCDVPIPVKAVGRLHRWIKERTLKEIKEIDKPFLIVQAEKSDLIKAKSGKYIFKKVKSKNKKIFYLRVDNHDFNLMDEEGKYLMMDMINSFIQKVK